MADDTCSDRTSGQVSPSSVFPMSKNLRVLVTSRCNYRCSFCHGEGETVKDMDLDENLLFNIVEANPGLKKIRITGGEPLLRTDLADIVSRLKNISDAEVVLTTNAYYLEGRAKELFDSGVDRLNVSLHSLDKDRYKEITGVAGLDKVLSGLDEASRYYDSIKVNLVVGRGNFDEIDDFIDYCSGNGFTLRLLDIIPQDDSMFDTVVSKREISDYVSSLADSSYETEDVRGFVVRGAKVEIKKDHLYPECRSCDKMKFCGEGIYATRLGVDGTLRQCLHKERVSYGG